jgi:hypothetical protein
MRSDDKQQGARAALAFAETGGIGSIIKHRRSPLPTRACDCMLQHYIVERKVNVRCY